ncbi:hypothetical protein ACFV2X_47895 [Streptomyces sp. NPDC059679]|uniref:ParB family protein n=1 Tax=Streptomyces sp. NPDC059679 TaxID=3346903 RepID=UPI0036CD253A
MTSRKKDSEQSAGRAGKRVRQTPAQIVERVEPDPVDVVLGDTTPTATTPAVADRDSDSGGSDTVPRQATGDTTTGDSNGDRRQRHAPRHDDMATGDSGAHDATSATSDKTTTPDKKGETGDGDMTPPGATAAPRRPRKTGRKAHEPAAAEEPEQETKESVRGHTFSLPPSLVARLRAAQWHTQLKPDGYHNVSELVRAVLTNEVERLEATHNRGKPFPAVGRLRTGPSPAGAMRGAELRRERREQREKEADNGGGE